MKIAFLLCSPDINGGTYVIFEHASRLAGCGHTVSIITREFIEPSRYEWHPEAKKLIWEILAQVRETIYDCVIATWWESPFMLCDITSQHYVYFVQSIESRFFPEEDQTDHDKRDHSVGKSRCDNSYFFSMPVITEATWIKEYLENNYNSQVYLVRNGIRKDLYKVNGDQIEKRIPGRVRVLIEGPVDVFHKNVPKAIELCRISDVDEVWLLTSSAINEYPGVDRVFSRVPITETSNIYRSCDILVKLSYVEGMFGPPLEMFHCGGTAIVYDVTGHDEYIIHDKNSLVVAKDDEKQVVRYLNRLCHEPEFLEKLKAGAAQTAKKWPDWQESASQFFLALSKICNGPPVNRSYLKRITKHFDSFFSMQLMYRDYERFAAREKEDTDVSSKAHNFVQVYTHSEEHPETNSFHWQHYLSGNKLTCSVRASASSSPLNLRIDPSIRIGILEIYSIRIFSHYPEQILATYYPESDFSKICLFGTCRWLAKKKKYWVLESYGNDPQLILPNLKVPQNISEIRIEVTLSEMGIFQYFQKIQHTKTTSSILSNFLNKLNKVSN